jgi:hypothetical protein
MAIKTGKAASANPQNTIPFAFLAKPTHAVAMPKINSAGISHNAMKMDQVVTLSPESKISDDISSGNALAISSSTPTTVTTIKRFLSAGDWVIGNQSIIGNAVGDFGGLSGEPPGGRGRCGRLAAFLEAKTRVAGS